LVTLYRIILRFFIQACLILGLCSAAFAQGTVSAPGGLKPLRIAITTDYPPFMALLPDGKPTGLLVEMWQAWSAATGTPITFVASDWAETLENVRSGKADIHPGMFRNAERAEWFDFSEPIHEIKTALFSRRVDGKAVTMESLNGMQVGVLKGGFQERFLKDTAPAIERVVFDDGLAMIRALLSGSIRAVMHEVPSVEAELAKMSLLGAVVRGADGGFGSFLYAGVRKGSERLLQRINEGFSLVPIGDLAEIEERWLPNPRDRFFMGGTGKLEFNKDEEAWLEEHPVVHLAVTTFIKPVDILTASGEYSGLNADLIALLNRKLGITIVPDFNRKWGDVVEKVMTGKVDGAFSLSRTAEREKKILFTRPYAFDSIIVVVRKGDENISLWEDVAGRTVSVTKGMAVVEMLKKAVGSGRVIEVEGETEGLKKLAAGKVDAHVGFLLPYGNAQRKEKVPGLRIAVQRNVEGGTLRIGVPRDRPALFSILRKGLNAITRQELMEVRNRWLYPDDSVAGRKVNLTAAEKSWIDAHPVIRVQNETDYPPFNFTDLGRPKGYSIDYLKLLAERIGVQVEFVTGPSWNEFLGRMKSGDLDVMLNIIQTPDRDKYIGFTRPFVENPTVIVVRDIDDRVKTLNDLKGLSLAVPKGFFYQEIIQRKYPSIKLHLVKDQGEALREVSLGGADAAMGSVAVMTYLIRSNLLTNLRLAGSSGDVDLENDLRIGVRKDWPELRSILEKAITSVSVEETEELRESWLGGKRQQIDERVRLSDEERRWLSLHRTVRLGVDPSWPPFDFVDGGVHQGLAADVLSLLGQRLSVEFKRDESLTWAQTLERAKARSLDVLSICADTSERRKYLSFTQPIAAVPWVIATRDDFRQVRNLIDLAGDKVALVKGYAVQDLINAKFPDLPLQEVDTPAAGLTALATGKIDAYVGNLGVITHLVRANSLLNVKVAAAAGFPNEQLRLCVRSDWPQLVRILNKGLASISKEEMRTIQQEWIPAEILGQAGPALEDSLISGPVLWLLGAAALVFAALVVLVRILLRSSKGDTLAFQLGSFRFRMLIISTLGVFATVVVVLTWIGLNHNKGKMLETVGTNVSVVLQSTTDRLDMWVKERRSFLAQFGRNKDLVAITERLLQVPTDRETLMASAPLREARVFFERSKDQFGDLGFFIINPDGISIGSMRNTNIGTPNLIAEQKPSLIELVLGGETVLVPPLLSDVALAKDGKSKETDRKPPTMFFATPIQTPDGAVLAVLTQRIDPEQDFSRVLKGGRAGATGESYAFDENGLLLSQSRFDEDLKALGLIGKDQSSTLNVFVRDPGRLLTPDQPHQGYDGLPLTRMANAAVSGQPGVDLEGYRDYRGVPVFGAWAWMEGLGLGVTTEIDADEALSTYDTLRATVLGVLAVTLILSAGATLFTLALGERTSRSLMRAKDQLEDRVHERTRELRHSEQRIRSIIENAVDGIIVISEKGIVESFSPAAETIFGWTADEVIGQNVSTLMPEPYASEHDGYLLRYLETGKSKVLGVTSEVVGRRKNGDEFPMDLAVGVAFLGEEKIFTASARDITARKEAEEAVVQSEERTRLLLESVGEGVFGTDLEGRITFVNPQTVSMLGFGVDELLGEKAHALFHYARPDGSPYPVEECWMYKAFTYGESNRVDDEVLWRKDGSPLEIEYNSTPIRKGDDLVGAVISFSDISARKEAERKLTDAFEIISGSIQYASRIQQSILPDQAAMASALGDHFVLWKPRDVVGGDFYWGGNWGTGALVILADCTGHGVPGAFMTLIASGALDMALLEVMPGDVASLIQRTHQIIQTTLGQDGETGRSDDGLELGACFISGNGAKLTFSGAKFDLFRVEDGQVEVFKGTRKGIGYRGIARMQKFETLYLDLKGGQTFYMTSDGLIDQVGGPHRRGFGRKRFIRLLLDIQAAALPDHRDRIQQALLDYQGDQKRRDDVSVIGFRR
jgi:PAS domain S-box-containing protein